MSIMLRKMLKKRDI